MSEPQPTLADQATAITALAQISQQLGHLPAASIDLSSIYPNRLTISLHPHAGGLKAWETWRAALGIPTEAATCGDNGRNLVLGASGKWAGADIELVGYAPTMATGGVR